MVNNREEAEQAVAACRYPPLGNRSLAHSRSGLRRPRLRGGSKRSDRVHRYDRNRRGHR